MLFFFSFSLCLLVWSVLSNPEAHTPELSLNMERNSLARVLLNVTHTVVGFTSLHLLQHPNTFHIYCHTIHVWSNHMIMFYFYILNRTSKWVTPVGAIVTRCATPSGVHHDKKPFLVSWVSFLWHIFHLHLNLIRKNTMASDFRSASDCFAAK